MRLFIGYLRLILDRSINQNRLNDEVWPRIAIGEVNDDEDLSGSYDGRKKWSGDYRGYLAAITLCSPPQAASSTRSLHLFKRLMLTHWVMVRVLGGK